ncbi:asparagine synthase-related protein [Qipengyuania marisflavi]|uniref:asparagine synthase (glutamine-hydrolyzing) n=1 Tax=Qipengyuania marisflavi TaxID=2486356 RepID=A0A5S3P5H4_9SPHN|nr:asparagine synthase-related protein [Qipengyuania marisflavi]TMM48289.1 hypothetical protein FEV51_08385 [Qipengyuania marisflavi]
MIAAWLATSEHPAPDCARLAATLGAAANRFLDHEAKQHLALAAWRAPGGEPALATGARGMAVAFDGWIANRAVLRANLGLADGINNAQLYAAALQLWGDQTDAQVDGCYAAIVTGGPFSDTLRLSRSAFAAPPLHYAQTDGQLMASSLLRTLELLPGIALRTLQSDMLLTVLAGASEDAARGWYPGTARVPMGTALAVDVATGSVRELWRYRFAPQQDAAALSDDAVVERAQSLLDKAVAGASRGADAPCVSLSGGLDSSLVAASLLRQSGEQQLHSYTYAPEIDNSLVLPSNEFGDESAIVGNFAQFHAPRLHAHIMRSEGEDFRAGLDELLAIARCPPREMGIVAPLIAALGAAADRGCDVMLGGDEGNSTLSATGGWAYRHYFRHGQWRRLWRELNTRRGDPRPLWRRFGGLVLGDWLPGRGPRAQVPASHFAALGLSQRAVADAQLPASNALAFLRRRHPRSLSQHELTEALVTRDDQGRSDALKALEARHGIPYRDPTLTRALAEFCLALPPEQFLRDGETRFLARRMARGIMPEDQRTATTHGATHADWHHRLFRARDAVQSELDLMASDEDIAGLLDLTDLKQRLEQLAPLPDGSEDERLFVTCGLPSAIAAARMIARAKGRNDI